MTIETTCRRIVPHYTLLELLGAGGMGEVFLARHDETGEQVAIKFLSGPAEQKALPKERRFEREARLMEQLCHPNIVRVLEHGEAGGERYLVMEYVAGGSLRGQMTPGQPMPLEKARQVLADVSQALIALEEAHIVHRDLKPENVLLDGEGRARVTDFGISAEVTEVGQLTNTAEVLGSLDYMAPEQRARLPADTRADQFSLAVIVYELLTGKRPLGNFRPASQLRRQLHSAVDAVIARALCEDPDERFGTVREFAAALDKALARKARPVVRAVLAAAAATILVGILTATGWAVVQTTGIGFRTEARLKTNLAVQQGPPSIAINEQPRSVVPPNPNLSGTPEVVAPRTTEPPIPEDPESKAAMLAKQAAEHLSAGRTKEALAAYSEAILLTPQDAALRLQRAAIYKRVKLHEQGLAELEEALRIAPQLAEARLRRGEIYVQMGDYDRALVELDEAIRLDERSPLAYAYRGWSHRRLGHDDPALEDLDKAIELDTDCGMAYHYRGLMYVAQQQHEKALADLRESVRCTPDNPFAHSALASLLATCKEVALRDGPLAITHAQRACELTRFMEWREVRVLARAHAEAGELETAIRCGEKAMELAPAEFRKGIRDQIGEYRKRLAMLEGETQP